MIVFYNPYACEGKAAQKWKNVQHRILRKDESLRLIPIQDASRINGELKRWIPFTTRNVVAAGGDGTVNSLVNLLMTRLSQEGLKNVQLGAIGLGSSNDFHKPLTAPRVIEGVPVTINLQHAMLRDVVRVDYRLANGQKGKRYFILNASCGITATANWSFNNPDRILHFLKQKCTSLAILYTAIKTILAYRSTKIQVTDANKNLEMLIANIGIVKNPYCAGSFCYDSPILLDNGKVWVHVCKKMSRSKLLKILWKLSQHKFMGQPGTISWQTSEVTLKSDIPFALEMDGEVIQVREARMQVVPKALRVCIH